LRVRACIAARLFHNLNRYNLTVGAAYPSLRIPDTVFAEFRDRPA
jgi:hypothetical protein